MNWRVVSAFSLLVFVESACVNAPGKPNDVPNDAAWAGGSAGGAWIACGQTTKEPYAAFNCAVYHQTGKVWARGHFIHARRENGRYMPVGIPFVRLDIRSYDGVVIHQNNGTALVPDGVVDYPYDNHHGKRATYEMGREIAPDEEY